MAKIKKVIQDGGIQYPATITDAVKNPNNGKTVTQELSELGSKMGGVIYKQFNVSGVEHSSLSDRINIEISEGCEFSVLVEGVDIIDSSYKSVDVYATDEEGLNTKIEQIKPNETTVLNAPFNIVSLGVYFKVQNQGSVTFTVDGGFKREISKNVDELLEDRDKLVSDVENLKAEVYEDVSVNVELGSEEHSSLKDQIRINAKEGDLIEFSVTPVSAVIDSGKNFRLYGHTDDNVSNPLKWFYINDVNTIICDKDYISFGFYTNDSGVETDGVVVFAIKREKSGEKQTLDDINNLKDHLMISDDGDIINLNGVAKTTQYLELATRRTLISGDYKNKNLVILHYSDIHGNEESQKRIEEYYNKYKTYIDDVISGGDVLYNIWDDDSSFLSGADSFIGVIGNHETTYDGIEWSTVPSTDVYNRFIKDKVINWGVVQPQDAEVEGYNYFYKDYAEEGIRMIVIDLYYNFESQKTWLDEVLSSALSSDLSVVVFTHEPYIGSYDQNTLTDIDCTFNGIIDLVNNANICSRSNYRSYIQSVDTFIKNGGEFIGWFCGHKHCDIFRYVTDYPEQIMMAVSTASDTAGDYSGFIRTKKTKQQDCFNVIAIDKYQKMVRVLRVGADLTKNFWKVNAFSYNYLTKKVYSND